MRVVYYANYFIWFETGRVELFRSRGIVYRDLERTGSYTPVVEAMASYKGPARFDDELVVRTRIAHLGNSSIRFENEVYKLPTMELICTGHTVHVLVGEDGKPKPIPEEIRAKLSS